MRIGLTTPRATIQDGFDMWQEVVRGIAEREPLVLILAFLFGLVVGSFLNVVIYRVPRRLSVVRPGSHCPRCGAPIRPRDNIPLLSFLLLKGRCRACRQPISWLYPAVELGTALVFVLLVGKHGWGWGLMPDAAFVSALIALAVIDAQHRVLPDAITYPGFVLAIGLRALFPPFGEAYDFGEAPSGRVPPLLSEYALGVGAVLIAASSVLLLLLERADYRLVGRALDEKACTDEDASAIAVSHCSASHGESCSSSEGAIGRDTRDVERRESWSPEWAAILLAIGLSAIFVLRGLRDSSVALSGTLAALRALGGAALGSGVLWLSRLGYYAVRHLEGVGFGDVKMMLMVGAFLGWAGTLVTIFLASLLGSIYGVMLMLLTRERNPKLPFGSFLSLAALVVLLFLP